MDNYEYRLSSSSLASNTFTHAFVMPFSNLLPQRFSANYITIVSHLLVYFGLYISYSKVLSPGLNFIIIPLVLFLYLLLDKLDGIHARKTKTNSSLGEFIDHFFDLFDIGALVFIFWHLFVIAHGWIVGALVMVIVLSHSAKFYDQYKSGVYVIDKVGTFEAVILSGLLILISHYSPVYDFLNEPDFSGYSLMEGILMLATFFGVLSWVKTMMRISDITYGLWLFVSLMVIIVITVMLLFPPVEAGIIILFYGGLYCGKLLMTQLTDGVERSPGLFTPLFLLVHLFTDLFDPSNTFYILFLYLFVSALLVIIRTFRMLKMARGVANE